MESNGLVMIGAVLIEKRLANAIHKEERIIEAKAGLAEEVALFNAWFAAQFGVQSDKSLVGLTYADASLIGPVPGSEAELISYRPLSGATVQA